MTERCVNCVNERAIHCDAIRAILRLEIGVVLESNFDTDFTDTKESEERIEQATTTFFDNLAGIGCDLDFPRKVKTSLDEMFAAGALSAIEFVEVNEDDEELRDAKTTGYLKGLEEALKEGNDIVATSQMASEESDLPTATFIENLIAGMEYSHVKDYCEERAWDPQALTDEQKREIKEYLDDQGLSS